ncbi:ABC transporter permease [Actinomadura xylanilytica]|nr:ABC transporter permease [Actinomadura xylanilytica]MDL4773387.1 ABC transporter permease [Actinomadura xylanilytica]
MLLMSARMLRERWRLFAGAVLSVALGVALVQSSLMTMASTADSKVPPGVSGRAAEEIREGYAGAATLLGMTVMLAGFLAVFIVGSTFTFTVAQRRRDLALFRMLGGSRPQLVRLLLGEALLLGLIGTGLGIALGVPGTWAQSWMLVALGMLPDGFSPSWTNGILPVSAGLGLGVTLAGVLVASLRAARVRPLEALRETGGAARAMTVTRWLVGLCFLVPAVVLIPVGRTSDVLGAMLVAMAVSIWGSVALSQLSPLIVPLVGRLLGVALRAGTLGGLAEANLRDGVRRSASTAAPLIVLVSLVIGLTGTLSSLARATGMDVERVTAGDLVVASTGANAARIAAVPGVATASPQVSVDISVTVTHHAEGRQGRRTHHLGIVTVDGPAYERTHRPAPRAGSFDRLHGRTLAVGSGLAAEGIRVGSRATAKIGGTRRTLRIVASVAPTLENGSESFLIPRELVPASLTAGAPAETVVQVAPGTSAGAVADRIRAAGIGTVRTVPQWAGDRVAEQQRGNDGIMMVLMGLGGLYAAVAVINAVVIAGAERRAEFATARVSGLSRAQVVRTALAEAWAVTTIGLLLGGLVAAAALAGFATGPGPNILVVPWGLLALLVTGSYLVTGLASMWTTASATRTAPVLLIAARE